MRNTLLVCTAVMASTSQLAQAQNLLTNGNLDRVHDVEIVPGFFLPKPDNWENVGFRSISGPYEDEMSSEPWAGPAPTPVTTDGLLNPPPYNANPDYGVFFKPFSGNATDGAATGHLYQDVPGTAGTEYTLSGWAGAEPNFLGGAFFAVEFLDASETRIGGNSLDLIAAGLFIDNGQPFDYKLYSVSAIAPAGTVTVRARASMIDGTANPAGGGQAYVVDDFTLIPEPSAALCLVLLGAVGVRRR